MLKWINLLRLIIILLKLERPTLHSLYETLYSFCLLKNEPSRTEKWTPATSKTKQQSQRVSQRNVFIHLQGWLCLSSVGVERALRFTFMGPQTKRRVATWTRNSSAESTDGLWAGGIANSTTTPIFTGTLGLVFGENRNIWLFSRVTGFVICFICCFIIYTFY